MSKPCSRVRDGMIEDAYWSGHDQKWIPTYEGTPGDSREHKVLPGKAADGFTAVKS